MGVVLEPMTYIICVAGNPKKGPLVSGRPNLGQVLRRTKEFSGELLFMKPVHGSYIHFAFPVEALFAPYVKVPAR